MPIDLSRSITADEAVEIAETIQREVDRGTAARQEAAEAEGVVIACARGCCFCCEEVVLAYEPEALRVARWLARPENAGARAAFLEAHPRWREAIGREADRLAALVAKHDKPAYEAAHIAAWRRRVLCAFNRDGDCTIYPVRPSNCRNAHAVDTNERCRGDHPGGRPATRLGFVPLDDLMREGRRFLRQAHDAVGAPRGRPQALCDAVKRLLESEGG